MHAWKKERVSGNERPHHFANGDSGKLLNKDNIKKPTFSPEHLSLFQLKCPLVFAFMNKENSSLLIFVFKREPRHLCQRVTVANREIFKRNFKNLLLQNL